MLEPCRMSEDRHRLPGWLPSPLSPVQPTDQGSTLQSPAMLHKECYLTSTAIYNTASLLLDEATAPAVAAPVYVPTRLLLLLLKPSGGGGGWIGIGAHARRGEESQGCVGFTDVVAAANCGASDLSQGWKAKTNQRPSWSRALARGNTL